MYSQGEIQKKALKYLKSQNWAVISSCSPDGEPHGAVMNYIIDDDFTIYLISINRSKKLQNIKLNNRVAITVGFGPSPITIQAKGIAEIIDDVSPELLTSMFHFIPNNDISKWPITKLAKNGFSTIIIKPYSMDWLNLDKKGHPDTFSEKFIKVI